MRFFSNSSNLSKYRVSHTFHPPALAARSRYLRHGAKVIFCAYALAHGVHHFFRAMRGLLVNSRHNLSVALRSRERLYRLHCVFLRSVQHKKLRGARLLLHLGKLYESQDIFASVSHWEIANRPLHLRNLDAERGLLRDIYRAYNLV